jgi:hypothetical protein
LVECKPLALVDQEENQRKFRAARIWCAEQGWTFRVVTDRDIRAGFRLENVKLLTRYARHAVEPATKGRIYAVLHAVQAMISVDDLAQKITGSDFSAATAAILCMAFHHEIFVPLDNAPLLGSTSVRLPSVQSEEVS